MAKKITYKNDTLEHTQIIANGNNPRYIKDEKFDKLVKSIKEFPEMLNARPLILDEDYVVLGGNMRLKACKELKITKIPVTIAKGFTDKQKEQFIIKDNSSFGDWDWDMLANDWDVIELEDWGLDIPGYEEEENNDKETPTEEVSFSILCENLEELNLLQDRLKITSKKISYSKFIELI